MKYSFYWKGVPFTLFKSLKVLSGTIIKLGLSVLISKSKESACVHWSWELAGYQGWVHVLLQDLTAPSSSLQSSLCTHSCDLQQHLTPIRLWLPGPGTWPPAAGSLFSISTFPSGRYHPLTSTFPGGKYNWSEAINSGPPLESPRILTPGPAVTLNQHAGIGPNFSVCFKFPVTGCAHANNIKNVLSKCIEQPSLCRKIEGNERRFCLT